MKRSGSVALGGLVIVTSILSGCGAINAAKDVKDAAKGLAGASKDAEEFQQKYERSKTLTFSATYTIKKPGSPDETFTIDQKPPKSAYRQPDSSLIDDGTKLYSCTKAEGKDQCTEVGQHTEAGLFGFAGFGFAFNPAAMPGLFVAAAIAPGVNASKSSRSIAGLQSDCIALNFTAGSDAGKKYEGCTSTDGVLTYSLDTNGSEVTLTRYETSVSDSAFTLPAQAKTPQQLIDEATSTTSSSSTSSTSTTSTTEDTTTSTSTADESTTSSSGPY
jgi:hypothetical protein